MRDRRARIGLLVTRTDDPQDSHGSNALLAPPHRMAACRWTRNRLKQMLMGCRSKRCKAARTYRAKRKQDLPVHRASRASHARRVNPAFSVLPEPKALPTQKALHSFLTIARRA